MELKLEMLMTYVVLTCGSVLKVSFSSICLYFVTHTNLNRNNNLSPKLNLNLNPNLDPKP